MLLALLLSSASSFVLHTPNIKINNAARTPPPRMLRSNYDLVVVGGGPVGVTAALRASALGYNAILIDATPPRQFQFTGPTGLFSKALRDSALRIDVPVLRSMGIVDTAIWAQVRGFVEQILRKSGDNNAAALALSRVPHLRGYGSLRLPDDIPDAADDAGRCAVDVCFTGRGGRVSAEDACGSNEKRALLRADNVLLATGSKALRLPSLGDWYDKEVGGHVRCYDSDSIKELTFLPRSVVVIGGGIIAIEFARIFAALAADVTMVIRASDLPSSLARVGIDRAIGFVLQADLIAAGVKLQFESEVDGASAASGGGGGSTSGTDARASARVTPRRGRRDRNKLQLCIINSKTKDDEGSLTADLVLSATGRKSVTGGLNLDDLGICMDERTGDVLVDSSMQTRACGVYAAGDLIGAPQLASTGIAQAEAAVDAMFNRDRSLLTLANNQEVFPEGDGATSGSTEAVKEEGNECKDGDFTPAALLSNAARYPIGIWTVPELAFVGLTAAAASAPPHNLDVVEGIGRYSESIRGHVHTVGTSLEGEYLQPCEQTVTQLESLSKQLGISAPDICNLPLTGPSLKLVVERSPPHTIVGVHVFGEDACELIHFGTTLVQERKTIADVLALCYAAVTYHELYKLAARDTIAILQRDAWRDLYRSLDGVGDGELVPEEVSGKLRSLGATEEAIADIVKALFAGTGSTKVIASCDAFVKRAQRLQSPLQLDLMQSASYGVSGGARDSMLAGNA